LIVAVIILGSMLMLHTAAVVDVQRLEQAINVSRENSATTFRVIQAAREAAQRAYGANGKKTDGAFQTEFSNIISALEDQSVITFGMPTIDSALTPIADFPSWSGATVPVSAPSSELLAQASPQLRFMIGTRVAESTKSILAIDYARTATGPDVHHYPVVADVRLVAVPLTRFAVCGYDLPDEIGLTSDHATDWSLYFPANQIAPTGLVPGRDPANVVDLSTGQSRPAHFRYLAALSEEYQYVFSQSYLQRVIDFAGTTHYIKIGATQSNPQWSGGKEVANGFTIDLGEFGDGVLGPASAQKNCGVICSAQPDTQIFLSDDGSRTSAVMLVVAGPSDLTLSPTRVIFTSAITRPVVLIGYHISLEAGNPTALNGAVFLDRESVVRSAMGPFTVGHVSYWQGNGGGVAVNAFRPGTLPSAVETLVPRVVYAVVSEATM
jgi:hypothetical protein